jgi:anthranilate synthase component 1
MIFPDFEQYACDAEKYSIIPVFDEVSADFETPLSVFIKSRGAFLLESVEAGTQVGRYSIIACGMRRRIEVTDYTISMSQATDKGHETHHYDCVDPMAELKAFFTGMHAPVYAGLPPFFGGAIGYLGYETARYFEKLPFKPNDSGIPDIVLVIPEAVMVYDSLRRVVQIIVASFPGPDRAQSYSNACALLADYSQRLARALAEPQPRAPIEAPVKIPAVFHSPISDEAFMSAVRQCKSCIRDGEIIQAVLSRQFTVNTDIDPLRVYQELRKLNPSPYLFYLDFGDFTLAGSSPEVMARLRDDEMLVKPIAGTRPRGRDVAQDQALARELLDDPKERAEHLMLVDLARNDLGRIARPGTVAVTSYMDVEKYSHVMHIVSTVTARPEPGIDAFDVIRAVFPAGTLSGAPKIRAMQIIAELEGARRGPYGGMILNLGFNGSLDSCITIRTIQFMNGEARIQAGAGIVADSVPEAELTEIHNKAAALFKACACAGGQS